MMIPEKMFQQILALGDAWRVAWAELDTPTIARVVPTKNSLARGQLLGYEPSESSPTSN